MQSAASTPQQYLDGLPEDRRLIVAAVREVIKANLSPEYSESMQ
jgi:hypothetical protein